MIGRFELFVEHQIDVGEHVIRINWLDVDPEEAGAADRITETLIVAGYRPDGRSCAPEVCGAYVSGQTVNGKYIRLPQETWLKVR